MFLTGWALTTKQTGGIPDAIPRIEAAARRGNATVFGSGMNPGFASYLACILTGICHRFRHVRITESVDVSMFAGDGNMEPLGWGLPRDSPGHKEKVMEETRVFGDALEVMAAMLGVALDEKRCTVDFAYATEDLPLEGRHIGKGNVAAIQVRWEGMVENRPVMELNQLWVMGTKIELAWRAHRLHHQCRWRPNAAKSPRHLALQNMATKEKARFPRHWHDHHRAAGRERHPAGVRRCRRDTNLCRPAGNRRTRPPSRLLSNR
ncbi:MAG: hypothetical protein IPG64_11370 [Haliea sp.]|nr:hypothetical protein [Haliea sp.]